MNEFAEGQTKYLTLASFECDNSFTLIGEHGEPVVRIDLRTGEVTMSKPVSEASQAFWDAVKKLVRLEGEQ